VTTTLQSLAATPPRRPAAAAASLSRIVITEWSRTWQDDAAQPLAPKVLDLAEARHLSYLTAMLINGEFDDVCFEGETADALARVERALAELGGAVRADPIQAAASRLFRPGYRVFTQGATGRFFVSTTPRPELFARGALRAYVAGFTP